MRRPAEHVVTPLCADDEAEVYQYYKSQSAACHDFIENIRRV